MKKNKKDLLKISHAPTVSETNNDPVSRVDFSAKDVVKASSLATISTVAKIISPRFGAILEIAEKTKQGVREEQLSILLTKYEDHFKSTDEALEKIKTLVATKFGRILFQKIIHLLDKGNADEEWLHILSNVLKNISIDDFEKHFSEHEYVLSQIDRLSPQALIVLSKYGIWSAIQMTGTSTTSGHTVVGNWEEQLTNFLVAKTGIKDTSSSIRIAHSFAELMTNGIVKLDGSRVKLTPVGSEIFAVL